MSAIDVFNAKDRSANRAGLFGGLTKRVHRYRTYRQTLDELQSLSDRELNDLNISRHMMRAIAYRAAYD
ncbi:MAG: DUF1127 domain-containing protein, partial [Boseongicola sp.]|nr:DUF1127 domain-containing protein [Boseongicola sp.]